jgi:hypothetical protein
MTQDGLEPDLLHISTDPPKNHRLLNGQSCSRSEADISKAADGAGAIQPICIADFSAHRSECPSALHVEICMVQHLSATGPKLPLDGVFNAAMELAQSGP